MDLYVCKDSNVKSLVSIGNSDGELVFDNIVEIDTVSQNKLLKEAVENSDPDKFSVIMYNNLVSVLEPTQITDFICDVASNIRFDIFYLVRYGDDCRAHDDFHTIKNISVMHVLHAHGIEALIISPSGKQFLTGKLKEQDGRGLDHILYALCPKMNNYSSFPTILNVDLNKRTNDYELVKGVVCREVVHSLRPPRLTQKNTSTMNLFWFILVIVFIFCVAAMVLSMSDKKAANKPPDENMPVLPYDPVGDLIPNKK